MKKYSTFLVCVLFLAFSQHAFALTEQEVLIQLGQLELRAQVLDTKASQVAGGSALWDKRGLLEEWEIVRAEAQKINGALVSFVPVCTPQPLQTQTLSCPSGQEGNIIQTRVSTCPGPIWSEWAITANNCTLKPVPAPASVMFPPQGPVATAPVVILGGGESVIIAQSQPTVSIPLTTPPAGAPPPSQPPVQPSRLTGGPIVPCGIDDAAARGLNASYAAPCDFHHFIIGINNIINFLIMIGGSIAAIVFAIAGFMILTAGANESQVTKAKGMFWSVLKGFGLMLAAWLLVKMVLIGLGVTDGFSFLG